MRTRTPQKSGVIGVTGVMKALKALRGVAFREITQGTGSAYTTCNLHHRCNASSDTIRPRSCLLACCGMSKPARVWSPTSGPGG